jgi:uncharacterized protein
VTNAAGCPTGPDAATAACVERSLSQFWSTQLRRPLRQRVVLMPVPAAVPASCRSGLQVETAFTCVANRTLYLTTAFDQLIHRYFTGDQVSYALASVLAHEFGHVLQLQVHQPQIETKRPTDAQTRQVEQQADCLSGVWAHDAAAHGRLDPAEFRTVAGRLITLISSNPEIFTHGTPAQRAAAIERGLAGGSPSSCHLATFH